jgi:RNA polymerase sigma factor (TIGR02999 family)
MLTTNIADQTKTAARRYWGRDPQALARAEPSGTPFSSGRARELIALDDALNTLAQVDPRKAQIVELRFFGGLSVAETAEVVKVSADTVMRDWKLARAWLLTELGRRG